MTPARLQTIEEIFRVALDERPDQIGAFLDKACEGDALLRRKVEALLTSRQRAGSFIETSAVGLATRIIQNGQADSLVGQTIGHYKISERIGTGGMGEVYLATDITAGRQAALKILPTRFASDAERLKRFQQEARAIVALNHPNILTVYEIGEDHSIYYIASELIEGETLRQRLKRGPMQLSEAVDVTIQVASALAAAHHAGIVHRDIKPENIMLRPDGYVKVLDFGIAKLAEQEVPAAMPRDEALLLVETNLGSILGTVRYMSPEQTFGAEVDKSADIWSLGVVLYEMVTGHAPFTGDTPKEVMSAILGREPPPLTRYLAHAPAELQQIISKTLRKDRKERYRSAHDLLKALKDLRHKLEFEADLERSAAAPSWLRWTRSPAALALVVLVAALALALPFYWHRNLTTSSPPEKSIAVLPFLDLSETKDQEYFCDGMSEEILEALAKVEGLRVVSRTSSFSFKAKTTDVSDIGKKLNVENVLEGSLRREGNRVRITADLINVRSGFHLWTETYDRELQGVFALQDEITRAIVDALKIKLAISLPPREQRNTEAYDLYLQGLYFSNKGSEEDLRRALSFFQRAVEKDPTFSRAWTGIAKVWYFLANDRVDDAVVEGQRTLQLDPNYFYLDSVLAAAYREKGNFPEAIALYTKAQEATHLPSSGLAITYTRMGREIEAQNILAQLLQAREKRYISAPLIAAVAVALGDNERAFRELERAYAEHSGILQWIAFLPEFRALHSDARFPDLVRRIGASQDTILAITETTLSETVDPNAQSHLTLKIGVRPRPGMPNGHAVKIVVSFYDLTRDNKMKPTNAQVGYDWLTPTNDWADATPKFLLATYVRP